MAEKAILVRDERGAYISEALPGQENNVCLFVRLLYIVRGDVW